MAGALIPKNSTELRPGNKKPSVKVTFLTGEQRGQFFAISHGERITIGRSQNCNVTIEDTKISREHAEFVWYEDNLIITDLKSQNGIIVNDKKVLQAEVHDGDRLIIGKNILKINFKSSENEVSAYKREKFEKVDGVETNKSKRNVFAIVTVLAIMYLLLDDGGSSQKSIDKARSIATSSDSNILSTIEKKERKTSKKLDRKVTIILQRGLRELREQNYFRAISEFNYALDLNPQDPQANFYLRKAKDELDKAIQRYNFDAKRDIASIKYKKGIVSYCAIIRLLQKYPEDKRYIDAKKNIEELEVNLGYDEGEIICIQE